MLTRIAVVGDDDQFFAQIQGALEGKEAELTALHPKGAVPPGTAAILGPSSQAERVVDRALELGQTQAAILILLADAIDAREGLLPGSAARLMAHAQRFAQALNLDATERSILVRGALLHDIGKLRVSNEVLLKKSVLDYDDWLLLRNHTLLGVEVLKEAGIQDDVADVVRYHHENFDGTGYPEGLEREAIPRLARAMRILDVYCAMTSPRLYRAQAHDHDAVITHLQEESGQHYDGAMVEIFIKAKVGKAWVKK